jgi:hypothetical protein
MDRLVVTDQLSSDLASLRIDRGDGESSQRHGGSRQGGGGNSSSSPGIVRKLVVPIVLLGALGVAGVLG